MCTYNLTFNDLLVEQARPAFPTQAAITKWMQQQVERMLKQVAPKDDKEDTTMRTVNISDRIKSLSAVPATKEDIDYKNSFGSIVSEKY